MNDDNDNDITLLEMLDDIPISRHCDYQDHITPTTPNSSPKIPSHNNFFVPSHSRTLLMDLIPTLMPEIPGQNYFLCTRDRNICLSRRIRHRQRYITPFKLNPAAISSNGPLNPVTYCPSIRHVIYRRPTSFPTHPIIFIHHYSVTCLHNTSLFE